MKYAIGAALLAAFLMIPVQASTCECPDPLNVSFYCINEGGGMGEAFASVSGGVPGYTYSWTVSGASILGGTTGSSVFFRRFGAGNVSVSLTVTDSCGTSKSYSRTCYVSGGDPFKRAQPEVADSPFTVGEALDWLATFKDADFEVTFQGFTFMNAMAREDLMDMIVVNIIDQDGRVTLILEETDAHRADQTHEIEER